MRQIGDCFEEQAVAFLLEQGLTIISRNFSMKSGEIDIVALDQGCLVFIEVRSRSNRRYLGAAASVDRKKQSRIIRTALLYLQKHPKWSNSACRFDVIAFEPRQSGCGTNTHWIRSAFTA